MDDTLMYKNDPGLFGPSSVTWVVLGDISGLIAGVRALLLQASHPEVAAGAKQFSNYERDPFGRLSRTGEYVGVTSFGAMPEVNKMIERVQAMHQRVVGTSCRGRGFKGDSPALSSWVHNTLVDSFLASYRLFGDRALSDADADAFVLEQTALGQLMGADHLPTTALELTHWVRDHGDIASTRETHDVLHFLKNPPLSRPMKIGYRLIMDAAISIMPASICGIHDLNASRWASIKGHGMTRLMRAAMGFSPQLKIACDRMGVAYPDNRWFVD